MNVLWDLDIGHFEFWKEAFSQHSLNLIKMDNVNYLVQIQRLNPKFVYSNKNISISNIIKYNWFPKNITCSNFKKLDKDKKYEISVFENNKNILSIFELDDNLTKNICYTNGPFYFNVGAPLLSNLNELYSISKYCFVKDCPFHYSDVIMAGSKIVDCYGAEKNVDLNKIVSYNKYVGELIEQSNRLCTII